MTKMDAMKAAFLLAMALVSTGAAAVDTVYATGLPVARARCEAANMGSKVEPNGSGYTVTCVARPDSLALSEAHTYVIETCRRTGMDARIDIYPNRIRVSCVVRP